MYPVYSVPKTKKSPKQIVSVIFFYVLLEAGRSDLLEVLQRAAVHEAVDDLLAERLKLRRIELRQFLAEEVGQDLCACIVAVGAYAVAGSRCSRRIFAPPWRARYSREIHSAAKPTL